MASPHDVGGLIAIGQPEDSAQDAGGTYGAVPRPALLHDPNERHAAQRHTVFVAGESAATARHKAKRTSQRMIHAATTLTIERRSFVLFLFARQDG
jgi:hypothetical protein